MIILKKKKTFKKFKLFVMTGFLYRLAFSKFSNFPIKMVLNPQSVCLAKKVLGCGSFGIAMAKCEGVGDNALLKNTLTHEQCIKQACLGTVNTASTLLTTTSSALMDICNEYRDSLMRILSLLQELKAVEGENPGLWDEIVDARSKVNSAKSAVTELNSYMESVEKVVTATTEVAFLAGAEYICSALCDRLNTALREINHKMSELRLLEEEYVKLQQEIASSKTNSAKKSKIKNVNKAEDNKTLLKQ